ncbi:MAG TPA: amino acid permease [Vicinamibacterales bacterium]|jgi:amino acid transporter|nr:amino acid permease [Vicinamibacterales bacterium]
METRSTRTADERLLRAIGTPALTANIINVTIGAGIFVLPAVAAGTLGRAAPVAYLVCAALMALIVTCFAAAGSRVSLTGGLYAYIEVAFGPFVGFLAGVLYWLMASFAVASVASAFASSIGALWAPAGAPALRALVIATAFAALAVANVRGVVVGSRLIQAVTAAKLLPLGVFLAVGVWYVHRDVLDWSPFPGVTAIGRTAIVLIYAFAGVEIALVPSGEVRDPARTVPRAVFAALAVTTTIYLMIQVVAQGLLGSALTEYASAPLAEAASRVLGTAGRLLVLGGAVVSMFGYMSGDMLGSPRALYAFGRDGILPSVLARVHPRFRTPYVAIILYACLVGALATSSSFTQLAILANVSALTLYLTCVAAAHELQRRDVQTGGRPFILPGGPAIPVLAAIVILWLLSNATRREFGVEALVLAVAALFYFIRNTGGQVWGRSHHSSGS